MKTDFPEKLLHYLWQHGLFDQKDLCTKAGEFINILQQGQLNLNSGPDFFNAKIEIANRLWVGNVEMHLQSRDWFRHQHHTDPAHDGVILHVVHEKTIPIELDGIPCLNLFGRICLKLLSKYHRLMNSSSWVPCEDQFDPDLAGPFDLWKHRLLVERLERRSVRVMELVKGLKYNWEEAFIQLLFQQMGFNTNRLPMGWLHRKIRFSQLKREAGNKSRVEAMLFGAAGMLGDGEDA